MRGSFGAFVIAVDLAGEGFVGEAGGLAGLRVGEAAAFAIEDQCAVVDEGESMRSGERFGAGADEVNVGRLFEDEAGGLNGIVQAFDAGDSAGFHAPTIHEEGVELDAAVGGEEAAKPGIEGGVIFKDDDRGFDGVERGASAGEDVVAGFEGTENPGLVSGSVGFRNGPCSAMDEQDWFVCGARFHLLMVVHRG